MSRTLPCSAHLADYFVFSITRCSYSELIRQLVVIGLEALAAEKKER